MDAQILISTILAVASFFGARWWELQRAQQRRTARQHDILIGLYAEIMAGGRASEFQTTPEERAYALRNEKPFQVADRTDFVFDSVKSDISILPRSAVNGIVRYYRLAEQSNLMTEALGSDGYHEQEPGEKHKFMLQLLFVSDMQKDAAKQALHSIEDALPHDVARDLWNHRMERQNEPPLPEQFRRWAEWDRP